MGRVSGAALDIKVMHQDWCKVLIEANLFIWVYKCRQNAKCYAANYLKLNGKRQSTAGRSYVRGFQMALISHLFLFSDHVIGISDLVDLWVIKILKSLWSFARVVRRDHANRAWNADHAARTCERFVYSIVKITRLYDYQTWPTHLFVKFTRCAKVCGLFFSWFAFRVLIGWAEWLIFTRFFQVMPFTSLMDYI